MRTLALLALFFTYTAFSQDSVEKQLDSVLTEDQAESFIKSHKSHKGKIMVFNEEKHKTSLAEDIFRKGNSGTYTTRDEFNKIHYKILEVNSTTHYRASIIFFDGNKLPLADVNARRALVIKKFNEEREPFNRLAQHYSMDRRSSNTGGDLGWFTTGTYIEDLEHQIISREHALDDVFTVDIPDRKWYYVVLKTHEPKEIKEVKVLKVEEPID